MVAESVQFYREVNLKKVEAVGFRFEIPEEWKVVRLGDVLMQIRNGITYRQNKEGDGCPITRIETISDEKIDPNKVGFVNNLKEGELKEYQLIVGDILFSHINSLEHIGKTAIYEGVPKILLHGMNLLLLRPNKQKIKPLFLLYLLRIYRLRGIFKNIAKKAVNQASINQTELKLLKTPLPSLPEQQKIVQVLTSIDKAIELVDKAIAKAERIKKGLMHELLTKGKGIGHTEFKDTEIGRIPKEWEVLPAEKVCIKVTDGTHDTPKPSKKGYYLITSKHLKDGKIDFSDAYFISESDFEEINKRSRVDVGDVLFSMIGTVGVTTVVEKNYPPFAIKNVGLFKTGGDWNLAYWLYYYFQSPYSKRYIRNNLKGSTQKYIPLEALRKFPIVIPSYQEQKTIIQILSKWDEVIELKKAKKEKLERMKKKVIELLLTGKIRVR